jgi:hypothetical protein
MISNPAIVELKKDFQLKGFHMNITVKDGLKHRLKHASDGIAVTVRFTVTGNYILLGRNIY